VQSRDKREHLNAIAMRVEESHELIAQSNQRRHLHLDSRRDRQTIRDMHLIMGGNAFINNARLLQLPLFAVERTWSCRRPTTLAH
jgi:hypothetical protein